MCVAAVHLESVSALIVIVFDHSGSKMTVNKALNYGAVEDASFFIHEACFVGPFSHDKLSRAAAT